MKEFKKIITKKEEINFSIMEETNGHFVYVPFKENTEHIPGKLSLKNILHFKSGTYHMNWKKSTV